MKINHVTLATRDVAATSAFFVEVFGWRPIDRPANGPARLAWLEVGSANEVHLIEVPDFAPSPFEREYGRHFAVGCSPERYAEVKDRLRRRGIEIAAPEQPSPVERFFFHDPNGYTIEVVSDRS